MAGKLLTLNNMGQSGLNSDLAPWELGPEYITHGDNFRVRDGSILPFSGSKVIFQGHPGQTPAGMLKFFRVREGDFWLQATRNEVLATADAQLGWYPATPLGGFSLPAGAELLWTGDQLGQVAIINHPDLGPYYWGKLGQLQFLELPFDADQTWQDKSLRCQTMRVHKNFLIALNLQGSEENPNGYRISHPAIEGSIPFTWDTVNDRSSLAVKAQLGSDGGEIVDGRSLRDDFVIYSRDAIDIITFNPNSEFYWNRRELSSTVGLLNTDCVTGVKGTHILIVNGDVVVNNGSELKSLMNNRLRSRFNARNNDTTRVNSFIARNDTFKEVWVCVPEGESETPNTAYVYNWVDDSWSIRDLPENMVASDYGTLPSEINEEIENPKFWSNAAGTWAEQVLPWGTRQITALNEAMGGINESGQVFQLDPKEDIDEAAFNMVIERTDYPLDGHRQVNTVVRAYPHADGDPFTMQFGSQNQVGGEVLWSSELTFDPGNDRKLDFRTSGEAFAWRVKSIGTNRFKLSGMDLEYVPAGLR